MTKADEIGDLYAAINEREQKGLPIADDLYTRLIFLLHEEVDRLEDIVGKESGPVKHSVGEMEQLIQQLDKLNAEAIQRRHWLKDHLSKRGSEEWNRVWAEQDKTMAEINKCGEKLARHMAQSPANEIPSEESAKKRIN
jgi:hypothetical protein